MTSARTISRLSRILALIPYVLAEGAMDIDAIVQRFGYTRDQLAADLNTVFVCGLPGYGPGELMEAYIDEDEVVIDAADYFARAPRLTPTEALSLLASGMAISGSGHGSPELTSAIDKLARVLVPEAEDAVVVDVSGESEMLADLRRAASEGTVVEITYRSLSKEEDTRRAVEPWAVHSAMGNWYLIGHCRLVDEQRTFRVDRIRELELTAEVFDPPTETPETRVGYVASDDDIVCDFSLADQARWVLDYYPVEVIRETTNRTQIRFRSPDAEIPARLLLRLGGQARLLRGDEVGKRVRELGEQILAKHQ